MLKQAIIFTSVFIACASASANCVQGEAQFIGRVKKIDVYHNGCRAFLTDDSKIQQHIFCPISESLLYSQGIDVGLHREQVCSVEVGQSISGILIEKDGNLTIE